MNNRILVTYASRLGSTGGVAEAIAKTLTESGFQVDVQPVQAVKYLAPYDAVVMGSAVQGWQLLPEAIQFVRDNRVELKRKPFAVFLVCMTLAMADAEKYRAGVSEWLDPVRAVVQPVSEGLFAGVLDTRKIPSFRDRIMFRMSVAFGAWKVGDHREWDAIRAWATSLIPLLQPVHVQ